MYHEGYLLFPKVIIDMYECNPASIIIIVVSGNILPILLFRLCIDNFI